MTRSIRKVLVANRGEIALRIMRSCHSLGIATVAVYSVADRSAQFVRFADEAVCIGGPVAAESYLSIPKILDAARQTGADAIHPGYGFLSENADFAEAVIESGLTFIGPKPAVIRALGKKREAKEIARAAGVPIVPGYNEQGQDLAAMTAAAEQVGFPILVKASAGGGGKGMRIVRSSLELADAIERARGEATKSFGDGALILERYVERPRHIEVQILGDELGNVIHLWERECSIQRRHQKVIEETPSVALSPQLRAEICQAAVALGKAVGYSNAGTVEFILDQSGKFYFLEVNTRLQVEHPVTEATLGIDLVAAQIRIARGEPLPWAEAPPQRGHAIEVRWCAEDPDNQFFPTSGRLLDLALADLPVRYDVGVAAGSEIGIEYDSMLGKVIAHGSDRNHAIALLRRALGAMWAPGLVTNREYLARLLAHPTFVAGDLHTHFIEEHSGELGVSHIGLDQLRVIVTALVIRHIEAQQAKRQLAVQLGWRNVRFADQLVSYKIGDHFLEVGYSRHGAHLQVAVGGKRFVITAWRVATVGQSQQIWFEESGGLARTVRCAIDGEIAWILAEGKLLRVVEQPRFGDDASESQAGGLTAPMPGKIIRVVASIGATIAKGDPLLVLEAMKMEHTICSDVDGIVAELRVAVGDQVAADQVLAAITAA